MKSWAHFFNTSAFKTGLIVGKDTKMPDYVVFFSTLGGIEAFGINGFVIGPVIAAMFIAAWETFSVLRQRNDDAIA